MTAPFFYGDADDLEHVAVGDLLTLAGDEGHHAVTVKRLAVGETVLIGDGRGCVAHAVITEVVNKRELSARVEHVTRQDPPNPSVTVIQALIKGERMERAIETLTEAGVDRIVPWQSQRSIVRVDASSSGKLASKLSNRAEQAAKQARRSVVPEVSTVLKTPGLIEQLNRLDHDRAVVVVLHEDAEQPLNEVLARDGEAITSAEQIIVVVGPEGGIASQELDELIAIGALPVRMGPSVMRASTAGTVALGWVMGASGRWAMAD